MIASKIRKLGIIAAAVLGLGFVPSASHATLIIASGNGSPTNTLQFNSLSSDMRTALLKDSSLNKDVVKVTVDQNAKFSGSGQASLVPVSTNFGTVSFAAIAPYTGFEAIELNPGFDIDTGSFTVTGRDQFGNLTSKIFQIRNGQNFFTVDSDAIQYITQVTLTTNPANINSIGQVRIGALVNGVTPTPEPSSVVMASTAVVFGLGAWLRRKRVAA